MPEPDYKRPFAQSDFRGYFRWTQNLTRRLGGNLYHACHEDELEEILAGEELGLRSDWKLKLPKHGLWTAPGTWVGLNYFNNGNHYGPCLLTFPLNVLNGKHFMVFRRTSANRNRYFFVQYEARLPIYSFDKQLWRTVKADAYFTKRAKKLYMKTRAIYDIVITHPIPLGDVKIEGVEHPNCISGKCNGSSLKNSRKMVKRHAIGEWKYWMANCEEYAKIMNRFPRLDGAMVRLFDPDDDDA